MESMILKVNKGYNGSTTVMAKQELIKQHDKSDFPSPNCEYPLRNGLCLDDARPLLQAGKVVLAKLCSMFVELTQFQCLRSGHKTCKRIMQVLRPTLSHGTC